MKTTALHIEMELGNSKKAGQPSEAMAKEGYKRTKFGWIPEDWDIEKLEKIGTFKNGINKSKEDFGKGYPFVNLMDVFGQTIVNIDSLGLVEVKKSELKSFSLAKGDVLFIRSSVKPSGVGLTALVDNDIQDTTYSGFLIRFRDSGQLNHLYKKYCFDEPRFRHRLMSKSTISANTNINQQSLNSLLIPLPPLPEQKKIAEILSTWDEAISTLERLIEKKEELKKGLMQQLLTGKKRFRGFEGEWKEVKIGTLGKTFNGLSGKSKNDFGFGKPYIPYKNVFENSVTDTNNLDYVNIKDGESQKKVEYGDIFFTVSSETPDEVGMTSVLLSQIQETYLNSFCFGFRLNDFNLLLPEFAARYFRSSYIRSSITKLAQGSTRYNLTKRFVLEIKINLPSVAEQKAIAGVFNELEKEITLLSKRSASYTEQKKGLMQQLLTGKRRVRVV